MKNISFATAKVVIVFICSFIFFDSKASNYFFSAAGNDTRTFQQAQSPETPWQSLAKLNQIFNSLQAGDTIFFNRGDVFNGSLRINQSGASSNPIVLCAYGSGAQPVISGFVSLNNWTPLGNRIWEAAFTSASNVNMVLVNQNFQPVGRFPNATAANSGYLTYDTYTTNTAITSQQLNTNSDWTNGEIVIRKNRWVLDRNTITQQNGNTIYYTSESGYYGSNNYGYFMQNHPSALDEDGEWYYNQKEKKFGIYNSSGMPSKIEVAAVDDLITISNQSNIVINDLTFMGDNNNAFSINNSSRITINNCNILFSGNNAFNVSNSDFFTLQNSIVDRVNNIACNIQNATNTLIKNNIIKNVGTTAGMGKGDSGSYEAILLSGNNSIIEFNSIDSVGYIPITFSGNSILIRNNFINHFALVKDDGGGIYTWNNGSNPPVNYDRKIINNIILNGMGAGDGTDDAATKYAHGIYMDDNSANVEITNNTIASCQQYGIYIHNARDISLRNNTSYNNYKQLVMVHDNIAPASPVRNITSIGNILFSKNENQVIADYKTISNDLQNFGNFDSNYYCRPIGNEFVLYSSWQNAGTNYGSMYDLDQWKITSNKDIASKTSPVEIPGYIINNFIGADRFGNGNFAANINGLYVYSASGNSNASWSNNGILDGGALKISFSSITGTTNASSVILNSGSIVANKNYILKFSMAGGDANKNIEVYLRQSFSPYADLTVRKLCKIRNTRSENEYLFTPGYSEANASIVFDIKEQNTPLYFDNIQLQEANVTIVNPGDSIRFEYNNTSQLKNIALNGNYVDARNTAYSNAVTVQPFSSVVLIKKDIPLAVLPVQFIAFTAEKKNAQTILKWSVPGLDQPSSYNIERSSDGLSFTSIGEVASASSTTKYTFTDANPLQGKNYYRIRETSNNHYSSVVLIFFSETSNLVNYKWHISPNPSKDFLFVNFNKEVRGYLTLYSLGGVLIKTYSVAGSSYKLNLSFLSTGMYLLRFSNEAGISDQKFIKE